MRNLIKKLKSIVYGIKSSFRYSITWPLFPFKKMWGMPPPLRRAKLGLYFLSQKFPFKNNVNVFQDFLAKTFYYYLYRLVRFRWSTLYVFTPNENALKSKWCWSYFWHFVVNLIKLNHSCSSLRSAILYKFIGVIAL